MIPTRKEITIIVPTYNKATRLKYLLESLMIQNQFVPFDIIIVDNGSTDETKMLVDHYKTKLDMLYLFSSNKGRSHARNYGLSYVKTKYVIFTDDDMILPSNYVKNHYQLLKQNPNALIHGKIWNLPFLSYFKNPETGDLIDEVSAKGTITQLKKYLLPCSVVHNQIILDHQKRVSLQEKYVKEIYQKDIYELNFMLCTGNNFSCATEDLIQVGGFDENMDIQWGAEDLELGYRLKLKGLSFIYDEATFNYHICHYRTTYENELIKSFFLFYQKHQNPIILHIPKLLLRKIKSLDEFVVQYL